MMEKIYTIPVNEAFETGDECPFCHLRRESEQRSLRYVAGPGASYMEPDVREATDRMGFCGAHMKKMYDYGNSLGNALVLQTYYVGLLKELEQQMDEFVMPGKKSLFASKKKDEEESALLKRLKERNAPIMLNSDCHDRNFLTHGFAQSIELLKAMGFDHTLILRKQGFVEEEL